jgi:hypothetical protein
VAFALGAGLGGLVAAAGGGIVVVGPLPRETVALALGDETPAVPATAFAGALAGFTRAAAIPPNRTVCTTVPRSLTYSTTSESIIIPISRALSESARWHSAAVRSMSAGPAVGFSCNFSPRYVSFALAQTTWSPLTRSLPRATPGTLRRASMMMSFVNDMLSDPPSFPREGVPENAHGRFMPP